ncbi:ABC transporter ATP-binding protein [Sinorhizobium mexicanum]|uniref:ABC transporter ATP-binding protein n=1 Tax=Sinorhizobium mexicanum TaxID=375549 RepID=A0A859R268_9HYPH|nr:ABC transporter ATP-binding protein [Sinorhizobium mexicanum]MBP1888079.1 iron(III) transport system ATP-binding protein [Sinorhizobium mexicanum]QLL65689.1 ABC transporter ATP-binding protein [Sinorhizobium mexicanum]
MADTSQNFEVRDLSKVYFSADGLSGGIRDANFSLAPGTFFTLLGPSGCGKTTTLRCIAGLEQPNEGVISHGEDVYFDGARKINVALNRRNFGMVFQSYAIWPHMSVFENVAFPLRVSKSRKYAAFEIQKMVGEALEIVGLGGFAQRAATRLSGGQQQRVALARAIVARPKLLLLDEPLSNLDAALREEMRAELKRLQQQIGVTTIYVTHDQSEALDMSDLIAVINQGRVVQFGSPREIYFRPSSRFVAGFVGSTNLIRGKLLEPAEDNGIAAVRLEQGDVVRCIFPRAEARDTEISVSVRPESISMGDTGTEATDLNRVQGVVESNGFLGNLNRYVVKVGLTPLIVNTGPELMFDIGSTVNLSFAVESTLAVPD